MKIVFGLIFFQAKAELERLLNSIHTLVPNSQIIAVDGRNLGYPSNNPLSTDGSRELLEKWGATIIDLPDVMEFEKREAYLREAEKTNAAAVIVVDSDHELVGDWKKFEKELKYIDKSGLYQMPIYTRGIDNIWRFNYMSLIVLHPELFHYEERHDKICINHIQQNPSGIINGILQINNHDLRTQDRIAKGYIYKVLSRKVEMNQIPKELLEIMKSIGW